MKKLLIEICFVFKILFRFIGPFVIGLSPSIIYVITDNSLWMLLLILTIHICIGLFINIMEED